MLVDVRDLIRLGKPTEVSIEKRISEENSGLYGFQFPAPYRVSLRLNLEVDGFIHVKGEIDGVVQTPCCRCLKQVDVPMKIGCKEVFGPVGQVDKDAYFEQRGKVLYEYSKGYLDFEQTFLDLVWSSVPTRVFCQEDCVGLCSSCGQDLNISDCKCSKENVRENKYSPFEKLSEFKEG